jgi:hypothetical protein
MMASTARTIPDEVCRVLTRAMIHANNPDCWRGSLAQIKGGEQRMNEQIRTARRTN